MAQTLEVEIEQTGATASRGRARSHGVVIDRPVERGGEDQGPTGGEYQLIALGGCFMSTLLAAIRTRNADVSQVRIVLTGSINGNPPRFTAIKMKVAARHNDAELVHKLITIAERGCIVTNTLRSAVDISVVFENA
jgi:putative redox protein